MKALGRVTGQALVLVAFASLVGLGFDLVRSKSLPLVANEPYQIYVPCPEITQEAEAVRIHELPESLAGYLVVDARERRAYEKAHVPGARSIPYDPLRSPADELIVELSRVRAAGILVYGDVEIDSGRRLGAELSSAGLRQVRYLKGGFHAWLEAGRRTESGGAP